MKQLSGIIKIESKQLYRKTTILTALLFLFVGLVFLHFGAQEYNGFSIKSSELTQSECKKLETLINVTRYGLIGLNKIGTPDYIFPLFYNSPIKDLQVFMDYRIKLNINNPQIGENLFDQTQGGSFDFAYYLLSIGIIIILIWSAAGVHRREKYFKFLLNFAGRKRVFSGILLARIIFIASFLALTFLCVVLQLRVINHIVLSGSDMGKLAVFLLVALLIFSIFSAAGMAVGFSKNVIKVGALIFVIWFCFTVFIPKVFNVSFSKNAKSTLKSVYRHELQKLTLLTEFEKSVYDKIKAAQTMAEKQKLNRELYDFYLKDIFAKIIGLEKDMLSGIEQTAERVHLWSTFTPCTFYKSVCNELSSFGLNGFVHLYGESIKDFQGFVNYCLLNRMGGKKPKDNPFIKNPEDYVFKLESSLPDHFLHGLLFNLLLLVLVTGFAYYRFKKNLFITTKKPEVFKNLDLEFTGGSHFCFSYEAGDRDFPGQLYNLLNGKPNQFTGKASIDGERIACSTKQDMIYLPGPDSLPGNTKIKTLLDLFAGLAFKSADKLRTEFAEIMDEKITDIEPAQQLAVLLKPASFIKPKIIILDNVFDIIPGYKEREICDPAAKALKNKDTIVIEFLGKNTTRHRSVDRYSFVIIEKTFYEETTLRTP